MGGKKVAQTKLPPAGLLVGHPQVACNGIWAEGASHPAVDGIPAAVQLVIAGPHQGPIGTLLDVQEGRGVDSLCNHCPVALVTVRDDEFHSQLSADAVWVGLANQAFLFSGSLHFNLVVDSINPQVPYRGEVQGKGHDGAEMALAVDFIFGRGIVLGPSCKGVHDHEWIQESQLKGAVNQASLQHPNPKLLEQPHVKVMEVQVLVLAHLHRVQAILEVAGEGVQLDVGVRLEGGVVQDAAGFRAADAHALLAHHGIHAPTVEGGSCRSVCEFWPQELMGAGAIIRDGEVAVVVVALTSRIVHAHKNIGSQRNIIGNANAKGS